MNPEGNFESGDPGRMRVELARDRVEHAQWRVSFLIALLSSHRHLPHGGPDWQEKEGMYLRELAAAQVYLDRVMQASRK